MRVVTRNVNSAKGKLQYPGLEFYSLSQIADAVNGADAVVNLAGEPIGTRCVTQARTQALLDGEQSRTLPSPDTDMSCGSAAVSAKQQAKPHALTPPAVCS